MLDNFLVSGLVTGSLAVAAAGVKLYEYGYEYLRNGQRGIDLLMWVAILSRFGLGLVFLITSDVASSGDRVVLLRFCFTLMMLVEVLRGLRKAVARKVSNETIKQTLMELGRPEDDQH